MATSARFSNQLLDALSRKDRQNLQAICEPVELAFADVLAEPGQRIKYVYFPVDCFISLVASLDQRPRLEVGMIGNEGMHGITTLLDVDTSPLHSLVQGAGPALRIEIAAFKRALTASVGLRSLLNRYLFVVIGQMAQTAACTRFHLVEERLARWLLMTRDRAHSDSFHLTQEFLAYMLGVRRVGITKAASALQESGLIHYRRGHIEILEVRGLEKAACPCYATDKAAYAQMFG